MSTRRRYRDWSVLWLVLLFVVMTAVGVASLPLEGWLLRIGWEGIR